MKRLLLAGLATGLFALASLRAERLAADFTRDFAKWQAASTANEVTLSLRDGRLVVRNTTQGNNLSHLAVPLAAARLPNYTVEARVRVVEAPADRLVALIWTSSSKYYGYFEIQDIGKYSLYDWTPEAWHNQRVRPPTTAARQGEFNDLKVVVIGQQVFYMLNGTVLDSLEVTAELTASVGVVVPSATTVEVESLSITPLAETGAALTALRQDLQAKAKASQKLAGVIPNLDRPVPFPFVEEFDDEETGWGTKVYQVDGEIRDGVFSLENLSAEPASVTWTTKSLAAPISGDFEMALTLKQNGGLADALAGLVFDLTDQGARRQITFAGGTYGYHEHDGKAWRNDYSFWEDSAALKKDGANTLTVRVVGTRAYHFINDRIVNALDYTGERAKRFGIILAAGGAVAVDRLVVRPLAAPPAATLAEWEQQARLARIERGPKAAPFVETFDDNRNNWPFVNAGAEWEATIANGNLNWKNKATAGVQAAPCPIPFNPDANFTLSMRARWIAGREDLAFGLQWGRSAAGSSNHLLGISGNGQWVAWEYRDNTYKLHREWKPSTLVRRRDANEIRVSRLDDTVFLWINGEVVADLPFQRLRGGVLAAHIPCGTEVAFEEVAVSYGSLSPKEVAAEKQALIAKLAANHKKRELGATYSVGLKQDQLAAEEAKKPKKEDWDAADKLNQKYGNKSVLRVVADRGQPARRSGTEGAPVLYYFYRNIGGLDYYMEYRFVNSDTGAKKLNLNTVICVSVGLIPATSLP